MRSKCNSIQRLLSDYIDGILPDEQAERIDQHLASCSKCRTVLNSLEKTNRILDFYIEQEPPDGYFDSAWTQVEDVVRSRKRERHGMEIMRTAFKSVISVVGLKFRILKNRIYDEFDWWANRVSWSKSVWKSVMVILLVFSAVVIDRTYFRSSIDKTFLQEITHSLSKEGFYLVKYTPKHITEFKKNTSWKPRKTYNQTRLTESGLLNTQKAPGFIKRPSIYSPHSFAPSVIKFENGFLTLIGNVEIFVPDGTGDYSQNDLNFVNLYSPKNITQARITHIKEPQLQINSVNIQDIQQSLIRRKDSNNENPFRVFLTDFKTSGLSFK